MSKTIKINCPVGFEEVTVIRLDPEERIFTRKMSPDGKYLILPRKETNYPKYDISCPSSSPPHSLDLPPALKEILIKEEKWCVERKTLFVQMN